MKGSADRRDGRNDDTRADCARHVIAQLTSGGVACADAASTRKGRNVSDYAPIFLPDTPRHVRGDQPKYYRFRANLGRWVYAFVTPERLGAQIGRDVPRGSHVEVQERKIVMRLRAVQEWQTIAEFDATLLPPRYEETARPRTKD